MRVILCPFGSHGDVHPFVGVGRELVARGHDVSLVTAAPFAELAEANGFDFGPVGLAEDFDKLAGNPDLWHPDRSLRVMFAPETFARTLRDCYDQIAARVEPGNTVIAAGTLALAARVARDKLGVPLATLHLQPLAFLSAKDPPTFPGKTFPRLPAWVVRLAYRWADYWVMDPLLSGPVNGLRRELGLPPVNRIWCKWRDSPDRLLGLFPDWFATAPDWPAHAQLTGFVPYDRADTDDISPALDAFLSAGPPPVVFTFGSAMRVGGAYFAAAAKACELGGFRGLILAKSGGQIPESLPPGVMQVDYAPFSRVFPRAGLVVHHGGIGTTARCLAAGVPQLIMPMAFDQPDNAARVAKLGVGRVILPAAFTPGNVAAAVAGLLADAGVRNACAAFKGRATDGSSAAADAILALLPKARP